MFASILNVDEINKRLETPFTFNFSKIQNVHIQSPSLVRIKNKDERQSHFKDLASLLEGNKFIKTCELHSSGFINIQFNLHEVLAALNLSRSEIIETIKEDSPTKYIFDYGGPNIGKSMHVGHLRPLNIGRALYNIYSISGHECISDIHFGDWGVPIAQILTFCYENNLTIENVSVKKLQEIYPKASMQSSEDSSFKNKVDKNLSKLNSKDSKIFNDWETISKVTIENVKTTLSKLNHNFDLFYGESSVVDIIPSMIENLEKNKLVIMDNGALISTQKTEPPILILKSDGTYLYMTTDLATVIDREKKFSPDNYIYVVDSRQSEHFKQLFSSVKHFNFSNSNFEHIGFGTINDSGGKPFKTREGDVYPLESLWQDLFNILNKRNDENNATILTNSVLVFSDLVVDRKSNYKFDIHNFTNTEGKTAIYLQYTRARIKSVLDSVKVENYLNYEGRDEFRLSEVELIISTIKFSEIFNRSKLLKEPHHLAEYLYEICQKFNSFYKDVRILDSENRELQNRRINLLKLVLNLIDLIFEILGLEPVEKM